MVSGQVREMQRTDPRKVKIVYERGPRWYDAWANNPRIAIPSEQGDLHEWCPREHGLRPYCASKTAERWEWKPYRPPVGELYFQPWEEAFGKLHAGYVILEPNLKRGASINKQWERRRWNDLAQMFLAAGVKIATVGVDTAQQLVGTDHIRTSIRQAAAVIANAKLVIVPEGALHHIAAAVGTPAVVIRGGYISQRVTGYDGQADFFVDDDLGCGMRVKCSHCEAAMAAIKPEAVFEKALKLLDGR